MSAQIIPFPAPAGLQTPSDRLQAALIGLTAALAEQKRALTAWRAALTELGSTVGAAEAGLLAHQIVLGELREKLRVLHDRARRLQDWGEWQGAAKV